MENNIFLKNSLERLKRGLYTDFLTTNVRDKLVSILNKLHIKYHEFIPFKGANKTIIYIDEYPKVSVIELKTEQILKHSDILGMLFAHNIDINKYGDIIIKDNHYYIVLMDIIKKYLLDNSIYIKNNLIEFVMSSTRDINDYEYSYDSLELLVSSLRLDNVVATLTNFSRSKVDTFFKDKRVLVNYEICAKKNYILKENDVISIRKYGKYYFKKVLKRTHREKYIIEILKYN